MFGYPSQLTRPAAVLPPPPAAADDRTVLTVPLDNGVPARIALDGSRALLLGLSIGQARRFLDLDPATVVLDSQAGPGTGADAGLPRDADQPVARLSLVDGGSLGDTVPVVAGTQYTLQAGGAASIRLVVDRLVLTAGSMRSPGRYGSSITLRWADARTAGNAGPALSAGDPTIPRARLFSLFPPPRLRRPTRPVPEPPGGQPVPPPVQPPPAQPVPPPVQPPPGQPVQPPVQPPAGQPVRPPVRPSEVDR